MIGLEPNIVNLVAAGTLWPSYRLLPPLAVSITFLTRRQYEAMGIRQSRTEKHDKWNNSNCHSQRYRHQIGVSVLLQWIVNLSFDTEDSEI